MQSAIFPRKHPSASRYLYRCLYRCIVCLLARVNAETFRELAEINFPKFRFAEPDRRTTTRACAARQINQTIEKLEEEAIDSRRGIKNK